MTPERFRQMRNLFDAAVERPTEVRSAFLQEACQGDEDLRESVSRLLEAHQQTAGVLDQPPVLRGDAGRMEGRRIGQYEILRELGRGGMGAVYLATRTDQVYRKTVAFKVVRPEASSEDVIRRFQQEREIVAGLDHPNIARLLDGGTTPEGLPYFVMEFVDGQPIDVYSDERQLSVAERLKLFRTVCAAVEYAHGRGVAHRDVKPGNILVTAEGVVKLLDFGIAKLLGEPAEAGDPLTRTGLRPMTPEYASPEQVKGESVGAASDQYSLGVVLYELLTGHRPYRMRSRLIHEVVRVICEEDPTLPSTAVTESVEATVGGKPVSVTPELISRSRETTPTELRKELSGDIDNILLRVLRKDPRQRYASVRDLSEDLQRRLEGEPVTARSQGFLYSVAKFLQRRQNWAMAAAALLLGLATGMVKIRIDVAVALFLFLGMLALMAIGSRSEMGPGVAQYTVRLWWKPLLVITLVVGLAARWLVKQPDGARLRYVAAAIFGALALFLLVRWIQWSWRERLTGALLCDVSGPNRWVPYAGRISLGLFLTSNALALLANRALHQADGWETLSQCVLAQFAINAGYLCATYRQAEIRQRGIFNAGWFFRWTDVQGHSWEQLNGPLAVLKLRTRPVAMPVGPLIRNIVIPAERRVEIDAILKGQLSEWPDGTSQSAPGTTL